MFRPKTLLVLGAAASYDFSASFPLGQKLKLDISTYLKPEPTRQEQFNFESPIGNDLFNLIAADQPAAERKLYFESARRVSRGLHLSPSIDHFLDLHRNDSRISAIAKLTLVKIILDAEAECNSLKSLPVSAVFEEQWCQQFAHICFEGVEREAISEGLQRLRVVTFNYDRTFERFLTIAIQSLYDLGENEAAKLANIVPVVHPYGDLGSLPGWSTERTLPFGEKLNIDRRLLEISSRIRTLTDGVTTGIRSRITNFVDWANVIIFLGFGYHRQNLELLTANATRHPVEIFGTAVKVSERSRRAIQRQLKKTFVVRDERIELSDLRCAELIDQHQQALRE